MRNGAIPLYYKDNIQEALFYAAKQSKTTHQGIEAYECCRLLTFIVIKAIKNPSTSAKEILDNLQDFPADPQTIKSSKDTPSIILLANSTKSENLDINWDWKHISFQYSPTRSRQQPGYIGSYSMDAMAMSLHCVYHTNSFADALIKCANYRGDADSVCSVTGQIAGAIYGWKNISPQWVDKILQWDKDDFILLRGYKLFYRHPKEFYLPETEIQNSNELIANIEQKKPDNEIIIQNSNVVNSHDGPERKEDSKGPEEKVIPNNPV